jgi:Flp pilus assembly protein TadD
MLLLVLLSGAAYSYFWWASRIRSIPVAIDEERYPDAVAAAQRCLRWAPSHIPTLYLLSDAYSRLGRHSDAFESLNRIKQIQGSSDDRLEIEYLFVRAYAGEYHQVEPQLTELLRSDHPQARRFVEISANVAIAEQNYSGALNLLKFATDRYPDFAKAYELNAIVFNQQNLKSEAIENFRRAISLTPNNRSARLRLANLLHGERRHEEARDIVDSLMASHPEDPEVWFAKARVLSGTETSVAERRQLLEPAYRLRPGNSLITFELARLEIDDGHPETAERLIREHLGKTNTNSEWRFLLSKALRLQRREEEAKAQLELFHRDNLDEQRVLELTTRFLVRNPGDLAAMRELVAISRRQGFRDLAARWCGKILQIAADDVEAHCFLHDYFSANGDLEAARKHGSYLRLRKSSDGKNEQPPSPTGLSPTGPPPGAGQ